jgi:hypothetical protein
LLKPLTGARRNRALVGTNLAGTLLASNLRVAGTGRTMTMKILLLAMLLAAISAAYHHQGSLLAQQRKAG